jgi:hypothetical protein
MEGFLNGWEGCLGSPKIGIFHNQKRFVFTRFRTKKGQKHQFLPFFSKKSGILILNPFDVFAG